MINNKGIHPGRVKIRNFLDETRPNCQKELQQFNGMVNYILQFMPHAARITTACTKLTRDEECLWTALQEAGFQGVKQADKNHKVLRAINYDNSDLIWLLTDVSSTKTGVWIGQCTRASSLCVFCLERDGRQVGNLCPGRTQWWQCVLIYAQDGRPGPIGSLVYISFLNPLSIRSVIWRSEEFLYSNIEKIRLYYRVSNFAINQPMLPVISDPGLYLGIFYLVRLQCGATAEPMGDGLGHMDDDRAPKIVILTDDGWGLPKITF